MVRERHLPDFRLTNENGREQPFHGLLADFNVLAIRRVPAPSHGPATRLLQRLLTENRGVEDVTVRGFDIRSSDCLCDAGDGPHIVFQEGDLLTICDSDCSICRRFGVVGYDRFFVLRTDRHVIDAGSIQEIDEFSEKLGLDAASSPHRIARAPPDPKHAA